VSAAKNALTLVSIPQTVEERRQPMASAMGERSESAALSEEKNNSLLPQARA
jgi:hypothetical protein